VVRNSHKIHRIIQSSFPVETIFQVITSFGWWRALFSSGCFLKVVLAPSGRVSSDFYAYLTVQINKFGYKNWQKALINLLVLSSFHVYMSTEISESMYINNQKRNFIVYSNPENIWTVSNLKFNKTLSLVVQFFLATDKSRHFGQPRAIIAKYLE